MDADFVEAQEIGVSAGSIYPVKDGYRDTVTIHGDRLEAIAVSISIYNAGGKRVQAGHEVQRDRRVLATSGTAATRTATSSPRASTASPRS